MPKLLWALIAMSALISQTEALAEDTAAGTSTADNKSWAEKHLKATYLFSASGMHTEALSGNRDGTGTSLGFDHFFAAGGKLSKTLSLTGTILGQQIVDEDD